MIVWVFSIIHNTDTSICDDGNTAVYNASFNPRALFSLVCEILLELILGVKIHCYISIHLIRQYLNM